MTNKQETKILLVEDHPIYREGLRLALTFSKLNCEVVTEASNVQQAVDYIQSHPNGLDLVMLDYFLPDGNGGDIVKVLKSVCPQAKILIITGEVDHPEVKKLANEGVNSIISKDIQSAEVTRIVKTLIEEGHDAPTADNGEGKTTDFTEREIEIIRLCVKGMSAKVMAETLNISPRTVEHHKERIFKKSGCNSVMELMKFAMQNGLL